MVFMGKHEGLLEDVGLDVRLILMSIWGKGTGAGFMWGRFETGGGGGVLGNTVIKFGVYLSAHRCVCVENKIK